MKVADGAAINWTAAGDGPVQVPDATLMFGGTFQRFGDDLKLVAGDGTEFLITGYFASATPPPLIAPNNAMIAGDTVSLLAGPRFPGQYAQAGQAQPQAGDAAGKVEKLEGSVTVQRADGTTHELQAGDPVFQSDVIATGQGSLIGVRLADGTLLMLQESSKLVINQFVFDPNSTSNNSALLDVLEGTFSLFAGKVAPTGGMMIKTPIATMGIRGTSILGVNVDAILGRLSLTQDPDNHVGFVEVFNNLNGDLFTILRTIFNKITLTENGLLRISPKTPDELAFDQGLTDTLHQYYQSFPQAGPEDTTPRPQSGSHPFPQPGLQEINLDNTPPDPEDETILLSPEELEELLEQLLQNPQFQQAIIQQLQAAPTAGSVELFGLDEAATVDEGSQIDTSLPFSFGSSGPGNVGFASLDGQLLVDTNGDPITTGGKQLKYVWDAENNLLTAVIPGEDGEDDIPVFSIQVDPVTGEVRVTIIGAVDHLGENDEVLSVELIFTVTAANGQSVEGTLKLNIDDDVPTAHSDIVVAPPSEDATYNIGLILDVSGSMAAGARLQLMKDAVAQLLQSGQVLSVFIVSFGSGAIHHTDDGNAWFTDIGAAIATVNGLVAGGGTNYVAALNVFVGDSSSYVDPPLEADNTVFYFLSDGQPGQAVSAPLQAQWEAFLQANGIDQAFAFGIGAGVNTAALEPVAFPNGDPDNPMVVTDEDELADTLTDTIAQVPSGNVLTGEGNANDGADDFGADGPSGIVSLQVDGVTYIFDGENIGFNGEQGYVHIEGSTLVVDTKLGGQLTFHFADGDGFKAGDWEYLPPRNSGYLNNLEHNGNELVYYDEGQFEQEAPTLPYENFRYTIEDGDGDTSTASLTIIVDPEEIEVGNVHQGTSGDDTLEGEEGAPDVLVGNPGADTFVLNNINVLDYIADYEIGEGDLIDLSALLGEMNVDQNNAEQFIRIVDQGPGAVDALQVDTGQGFTTVALFNGDAGANIVVDDGGAQVNVNNPANIA